MARKPRTKPAQQLDQHVRVYKTLLRQYNQHVLNTRDRTDKAGNKILFLLTFDEWLEIWMSSGQIFNRGRSPGQYVMSRNNDLGHYEVGNVAIVTATQNHVSRVLTPAAKAKISNALKGQPGREWTQESKDKLAASHKGKIVSKETRDKISAVKKANNLSRKNQTIV